MKDYIDIFKDHNIIVQYAKSVGEVSCTVFWIEATFTSFILPELINDLKEGGWTIHGVQLFASGRIHCVLREVV